MIINNNNNCSASRCIHSGMLRLLLLAFAVSTTMACSNFTTCGDCLNDSCVWAPVAGCLESCNNAPADASCFDAVDTTSSVEEICATVAEMEADAILCQSQATCGDCVATFLEESKNSTCQWFGSGYCDSACGMDGCGATECAAAIDGNRTDDACEIHPFCEECLGDGCAWTTAVGCLASCDMIADVACYAEGLSFTIADTCQAANDAETDAALCAAQTDCGTCVGTATFSDSTTFCQWFEEGSLCASGCGMSGCGTDTCDGGNMDASDEPGMDDEPSPTTSPTISWAAGNGLHLGLQSIFLSYALLVAFF